MKPELQFSYYNFRLSRGRRIAQNLAEKLQWYGISANENVGPLFVVCMLIYCHFDDFEIDYDIYHKWSQFASMAKYIRANQRLELVPNTRGDNKVIIDNEDTINTIQRLIENELNHCNIVSEMRKRGLIKGGKETELENKSLELVLYLRRNGNEH